MTKSPIAPQDGLPIEIGSKWSEQDPRINRVVEVHGFTSDYQTIILKSPGTGGRITRADVKRFSGRRGGYKRL